jgi:hypothetical protein
VHQAIEAVKQEADVFLVGWEGEDYGEVFGETGEGGDIAGDYWEMIVRGIVVKLSDSTVIAYAQVFGGGSSGLRKCGRRRHGIACGVGCRC